MNTYIALTRLDVSSGFIEPGETIELSNEIAPILVAGGHVAPLDHEPIEEEDTHDTNNAGRLLS